MQGDFFSEMPFAYVDEEGQVRVVMAGGQLLSNSCDATRNDNLLFAAVLPLEAYTNGSDENKKHDENTIKNNLYYDLMYYPDNRLADKVVDFGLLTTFSRELFEKIVGEEKVKKVASLSNIGYYLMLSKLTVYLLRPESEEISRKEEK